MFQIILSIISLPLLPHDNAEATQEFSLPLQDLPPSRTYCILPGSNDAGEMENAHLTGCELSVSVRSLALPENSQLSSPQPLLFFCHPAKSCPACGELHIHSQGSKQRMSSSPNKRGARELQNAHRCHLTYTLSLWDRLCSSNYKNKENGIFLRGVKAIHPAW